MGCHTWFSRPITDKEFEKMKENAPKEIYELTHYGIDNSCDSYNPFPDNIYLYNKLMESYNDKIPCVDGKYWWQLGYGAGDDVYKEIKNGSGLYIDVIKYIDTFRVPNYPRKIIRSRRDLRRFLRKRYFKLTDKQLERVSQFFREYPGGVITFG